MYYWFFPNDYCIDKVFLGDPEREDEEDKQLVIAEAMLWWIVCFVCNFRKLLKPAHNVENNPAQIFNRVSHKGTRSDLGRLLTPLSLRT